MIFVNHRVEILAGGDLGEAVQPVVAEEDVPVC